MSRLIGPDAPLWERQIRTMDFLKQQRAGLLLALQLAEQDDLSVSSVADALGLTLTQTSQLSTWLRKGGSR